MGIESRKSPKELAYSILPFRGQFIADRYHAEIEVWLRWQTRGVEPSFPVNRGNLLLDCFVTQAVEEIQERVPELKRIERFAGPFGEVVGNKLVKGLAAYQPIQIPQEVKALFVGYCAVNILGIDILVADDELGVLMVFAEEINSILWQQLLLLNQTTELARGISRTKGFPADDGGEVEFWRAVYRALNPTF